MSLILNIRLLYESPELGQEQWGGGSPQPSQPAEAAHSVQPADYVRAAGSRDLLVPKQRWLTFGDVGFLAAWRAAKAPLPVAAGNKRPEEAEPL
jgi:hypothetical protein